MYAYFALNDYISCYKCKFPDAFQKGMGSDGSKLSDDDISSIKSQTRFSSKEIQEMFVTFREDYPDGTIAKEEFIDFHCRISGGGDDARQLASYIFRMCDQDGSGVINFHEYMTMLSISQRGSVDDKLEWAFGMYDLNGDGVLTQCEVLTILKAISNAKGVSFCKEKADDTVEQIFMKLDKNKDEAINKEEFLRGAKSAQSVLELLQ